MKQKIKIIQKIIFIFFISFPFSAYAMTVEEIIKGRKAMFSENYQNAKKISILLKSKRIEEAKPLMKKISDNYIKLLDYFPENTNIDLDFEKVSYSKNVKPDLDLTIF
mgnify:CR=1 FL=1